MQNGNDTTRNRIKLIWLFAVFFVLLIVTVSVVIYFIGSQKKAVIDNADSKLSSALTKDEISAIESIFYTRTSGWHTFDQSKKTDIVVRDSTVKTEYPVEDKTFRRVTFLMDADDIKMTYFVTVNLQQGQEIFDSSVTFTCPEPDQMKYPGVFCQGDDGTSTIDYALGDILPYNGKTTDGINYRVWKQKDKQNTVSLFFYSNSCKDGTSSQIVANFKEIIKNRGYDPEIFTYNTEQVVCGDQE